MTCEHGDLGKEIKSKDLAVPLFDYMVSRDVFKVKQMSGYDLCHFYQVGGSGDLPPFPSPHQPATHERLSDFLHKAEVRSQLIVTHVSNSITAVSLLSNWHNKTSLHHLLLECKGKTGGKHLSFCPFCLYMGSNNKTYMNYIIGSHYDAVYSCGKCLDKVTMSG